MSETTQKAVNVKLNVDAIADVMNCCKELTQAENAKQIYIIGDMLSQAIVKNIPIYLTGIGKPGYVAQKFAASLKSIKVDAEFIDATLAGHGDLGPIPTDNASLLIALSKSGCSKELYGLFEVLGKIRPKCTVMLICMSNDAQFETVKACKAIHVPCRFKLDPKEMDGYGIVPSTSNAIFEVILDTALSNAFMNNGLELKHMCERLQQCHPSGTLYNKVTKLLAELNAKNDDSEPAKPDEVTVE